MIKQISHVCFGCKNLSKSIEFYKVLFSFDIAHEYRNDNGELYGVFFSCGGNTFLELFNEPKNKSDGGMFRHVCFEVDDLNLLASTFTQNKIHFEQKRGRSDSTLQAFVIDPDGNKIEFHQYDRKSSLWPYLKENH